MTEKPEYRMRLIGNHQNHAAIINMFAADGYELVTALPATDSDYRCIFRLRPATDATAQTQRERAEIEERLATVEVQANNLAADAKEDSRRLADVRECQVDIMESLRIQRTKVAAVEARLDGLMKERLPEAVRELQQVHDALAEVVRQDEARLDGLPEQLGKPERVLLDRIEALEARVHRLDLVSAEALTDLVTRVDRLEPQSGPTPVQVQAQLQTVADRLGMLEARLGKDEATRTVTCPVCSGRGTSVKQGHDSEGYRISHATRCSYCHGTGRVPEPAPAQTRSQIADPVTGMVTCSVCGGRGRLGDRTFGPYGDEVTSQHHCSACGGTGWVPA